MVSTVEQPGTSRAKRALGVCIVAVAHVAYTFVTYRAGVLTHSGPWSSDLLVFAVPTLLAFIAYASLLHGRRTSWMLALSVSIGLTFLSFWLSIFIAFNTYGT
jgi:hypothetical protein